MECHQPETDALHFWMNMGKLFHSSEIHFPYLQDKTADNYLFVYVVLGTLSGQNSVYCQTPKAIAKLHSGKHSVQMMVNLVDRERLGNDSVFRQMVTLTPLLCLKYLLKGRKPTHEL